MLVNSIQYKNNGFPMQSGRYGDLKHKLILHNASYTFRYVTPHNIHRINIRPRKKKKKNYCRVCTHISLIKTTKPTLWRWKHSQERRSLLQCTDQSSVEATSGVRIWLTSPFARGWCAQVGEGGTRWGTCWPWMHWRQCSADSSQTATLHNLKLG